MRIGEKTARAGVVEKVWRVSQFKQATLNLRQLDATLFVKSFLGARMPTYSASDFFD